MQSSNRYSARSGFALVIVLAILVLLVALAVGFLLRTSTERTASSSYQASISARQLADTVVGMVQGQINMATTQGSKVPWVSQPGMVRSFDSSGNLLQAYKLYSAPEMISGSALVAGGKSIDEPPETWASDTAVWSDLNAPVEVGQTKYFPILDGSAATTGSSAPAGYTLSGTIPGVTAYQPVPMPVRWLYMLRNGKFIAATGSGAMATVSGETAANPIVGRVAFWTDDETCKLNINTASEGTFWDVPHAETNQEHDLGNYQPAQKEFQRYPGHPAMTSLSSALPLLTPNQIFQIVPRVVGGGSQSGTSLATAPLVPDGDRLYASVDELVFTPARTSNPPPPDTSPITRAQLEQAKFFLTAHSRAPETNLSNLPRIACWPIFKNLAAGRVTPFDGLIAFCSSSGTGANQLPYYFQREMVNSGTNDISIPRNTQLYSYLQYLTENSVPGFGGDFLTKYGTDRDQILTEIFDYIRCTNLDDDLLATNQQFTTYWDSVDVNTIPTGHGWVAPTINTHSTTTTMGMGRTLTLSELGIGFICNAMADDSSTSATDESYGSNNPATNPVLSGTALAPGQRCIQAIIIPELFSPMHGYVELCPNIVVEISGLASLQLTNPVSMSLFPVSSGTVMYDWVTTNYDSSRIWGGNPGWQYSLFAKGSPPRGSLPGDSPGGSLSTSPAIRELYPFIGTPIRLDATGGSMTMSDGNLTVKIYAGSVSTANLIQTIHVKLPGGTFPLPTLVNHSIQKAGGTTATSKENWWAYSAVGAISGKPGRLYYHGKEVGDAATPGAGAFFLQSFDVVRTVLPVHGDYRLIAASPDVPVTVFAPHPDYNTNKMFASCLSSSITGADPGFSGGKYISSLNYNSKWLPDIPSTASGTNTPQSTGDYDNGVGRGLDGPFVNKPDEGAVNRSAGRIPYFDNSGVEDAGGKTFFSPNRQIPSAGMFGSLPTGVMANVPWRTLLFRPQPSHFGSTSPRDHLLLDLFWMPVVEPYAISDRFSTAGKINMNYQILPFTYIERSTGLRALLKAEKMTIIPNSKVGSYKTTSSPGPLADTFRLPVDADRTLGEFKAKFDNGLVFKTASEICDIDMVPAGQSGPIDWTANALTGDNTRERIYTTLYPRLTTRSNTFTVHFRAQALKKVNSSVVGTWTEGRDVVTGEYRGSTTIERFVDANNPAIPDYAADPTKIPNLDTLDKFYKWRVVQNRQFAP